MKAIVIVSILAIFLIGFSYSDDETSERINEGASTSTAEDEEIDECTRCEIQNNARNFVILMTAEDMNNVDLNYMVNNEFPQLEAFYEALNSLTVQNRQPYQGRNARLRYFHSMLEQYLKEIVEKSCREIFHHRYSYRYVKKDRAIVVREVSKNTPGNCLCFGNRRDKSVVSVTSRLPLPKTPEKKNIFFLNNDRITEDEVTLYYFIPLPLISRFFRLWLMDDLSVRSQEPSFTKCRNMLFKRLRRSMQKILLYSIKKSDYYSMHHMAEGSTSGVDDFSFSDETLILLYLVNSHSWMSGNTFVGPTERGPFSPTFERTGDQLVEAFEYHAEPLIGRFRYLELLNLFRKLHNYVQRARTMTVLERLFTGFNIFAEMTTTFNQYDVTRFDADQWEQKITLYAVKKFWEMRPKRDPRSLAYYDYKVIDNNENITRKIDLKHRWRKFVSDIMSVSLEAYSSDESLKWSCNLTYLYSEYFNITPNFNLKCPECLSFDEFLYLRVENRSNWETCNFEKKSTNVNGHWCTAWRRIVKTMDAADELFDNNLNGTALPRWKLLSKKDVGTIITWLVSSDNIDDKETKSETRLIKFSKDPLRKPPGFVELVLCYIVTIVPTILSLGSTKCLKSMR